MQLGILCSGNLGLVVLQHLSEKYTIDFILTDSKSESIISFCHSHKIDIFKGNPRNGAAADFIKDRNVDVLISVNYLFLIEDDIINLPKQLIFNIHGSLLPKYRGRTPHVWAIINNEKETGITAHVIDEGCDTGAILEQIIIPIHPDDTGYTILQKYEQNYTALIEKVLQKFENDTLNFHTQDEESATYFGKRTPEDGLIDWNWQRERICNWVRAQANPYPGAFTFVGKDKVIIDRIQFSERGFNADMPNGLVVSETPQILVKTPNGLIELAEVRENRHLCKKEIIFNTL